MITDLTLLVNFFISIFSLKLMSVCAKNIKQISSYQQLVFFFKKRLKRVATAMLKGMRKKKSPHFVNYGSVISKVDKLQLGKSKEQLGNYIYGSVRLEYFSLKKIRIYLINSRNSYFKIRPRFCNFDDQRITRRQKSRQSGDFSA